MFIIIRLVLYFYFFVIPDYRFPIFLSGKRFTKFATTITKVPDKIEKELCTPRFLFTVKKCYTPKRLFLQTFMALIDVVLYITNRLSYLSATVTDCRLVDCG